MIREVLAEPIVISSCSICNNKVAQEDQLTSLDDIAKLFNYSLPTAQKIKNSIPKDSYRQCKNTFAIKRSVLLGANEKLNKTKYSGIK